MDKTYCKLNIYADYSKERWFIINKYDDARKVIGQRMFKYILNQNIPGAYDNKNKKLRLNVLDDIKKNKKDIKLQIEKQLPIIQDKWEKIDDNFFHQIEKITGIKWQHKEYNLYLLYSCFWGGDYDIDKPNIYISPLLKYGEPIYIICHELSHLLFWEYIFSITSKKFVKKNYASLWRLSEIMVNYPLLKIKLAYKFPLVIPPNIKNSNIILKKFSLKTFSELIDEEIKKMAR